MATGIEIARELVRICESGMRCEEAANALIQRFPSASRAELERGINIACDQVEMWGEEDLQEWNRILDQANQDADRMMAVGASHEEIRDIWTRCRLATDKFDFTAETLFPTKPDKTKS